MLFARLPFEWNQWLGRIRVEGGIEQKKVKFYSDLFHRCWASIVSDVDGKYFDMERSRAFTRFVRRADGKPLHAHFNE